MNKSILKHETRSMKWVLLLSIIASLFSTIMFSLYLDSKYQTLFFNGISGNRAMVQEAFRNVTGIILVLFTMLSVIQIFVQFRPEKNQEIGRFLKSLPVSRNEFFKIKLISGILNISLAFIVLLIGMVIVRSNNMFWIEDIHNISILSDIFIKLDGVGSIAKEIGLIYLIILSFYTFLFMVQYTFSNVVGGIVTGVLVWLAPTFITITSIYTLNKFIYVHFLNIIEVYFQWLLPWLYVFEYDYNIMPNDIGFSRVSTIESLGIKYIICLVLILLNIAIAYKLNAKSKIENENMIIPFKSTKKIFKLGVTICSGLLASTVLLETMGIHDNNGLYILLMLLGGSIGYFVSKKIAEVGN